MSDNGSTGTADGGGDVNGDDEAARALRELAEASGRAMLFGGAPSPAGSALFPSLAGTALDDNGTEGQAPGAGPPLIGAVVPPEWQQNPSEALPNLCGHLKELLCAVVGACDAAVARRDELVAPGPIAAPMRGVSAPAPVPPRDQLNIIERGYDTINTYVPQPDPFGGLTGQPPFPLLDPVHTITDVLDRLEEVIDWAIAAQSGLGYFAAAYKRVTLAVEAGINNGHFSDGDRMAKFDVMFAQRYFDALVTYFHPEGQRLPTHTWQWDFYGHDIDRPTILQHMLTSINAHVNLDLGIVAAEIGGADMDSLESDFNLINDIMAAEMTVFLDALAKISKVVRLLRWAITGEDFVLGRVLVILRSLAWTFATKLNSEKSRNSADIDLHDAWTALLGANFLYPPGHIDRFMRWIANGESRDVAANIRVFDTGRRD